MQPIEELSGAVSVPASAILKAYACQISTTIDQVSYG